jgi:hypothetical protein
VRVFVVPMHERKSCSCMGHPAPGCRGECFRVDRGPVSAFVVPTHERKGCSCMGHPAPGLKVM